jgi:hypothetical protein
LCGFTSSLEKIGFSYGRLWAASVSEGMAARAGSAATTVADSAVLGRSVELGMGAAAPVAAAVEVADSSATASLVEG